MILQLYEPISPSGNPSGLTGILPGGAATIVSGSEPNPWLGVSTVEPVIREVFDNTSAGPVAQGYLLGLDPTAVAGSVGGGLWKQNATSAQKYGAWQFGIVQRVARAKGELATVVVNGVIYAACTTNGTNAIAVGTGLVANGDGTLTNNGTSAAGTVLAVALGTLAISSGPTLVPVFVGGY